jgi:hypothetical protein
VRLVCALGLLIVTACSEQAVKARQDAPPSSAIQLELDQPDGLSAPTAGIVDHALVRLDLKTHVIRTVEGLVHVPEAETPEQAAKTFIEATFHLSFAGDVPTRLMLDRKTDTLVGQRLTYQMYYVKTDTLAPLQMAGSILVVHVNKRNIISYASNDTVPVSNAIVIRASSAVTRLVAERTALEQHGSDGASITSATQIVVVSKGTPVLLWKVNILKRSPPGAFEMLLDGATGRVLLSRNVSVYKG